MPSRRDEIAMSPAEIHAYLVSQPRVILVSNGPDGYPHPMPMNFVFEGGTFLMTTFRKSQKVLNFRRDPRAALLVESGLDYHELASVMAFADADIVEDMVGTLEILTMIGTKEARGDSERLAQVHAVSEQSAAKRVGLRFTPDSFVSWDHRKLQGRY